MMIIIIIINVLVLKNLIRYEYNNKQIVCNYLAFVLGCQFGKGNPPINGRRGG